MKKLFIILLLSLIPFMVQAEEITVNLVNAKNPIEGTILSFSDTLVVIEPKLAQDQKYEITPDKVKYLYISGIGRYYSIDGKFVPDQKTKAKLEKTKISKLERERGVNNLNAEIARAFKAAGGSCLGFGIPALIAGTVLVGIGNSNIQIEKKIAEVNSINDYEKFFTEVYDETIKKSRCASAGYVLMSTGAALTIVGIPLYIHGKRIGELNFNYTGNGAGLSMNF